MKKYFVVGFVIAFGSLVYLGFQNDLPKRLLRKAFWYAYGPQECSYKLDYFDFHHKAECDTPSIIMLGNSIVHYGDWTELLHRNDVINRGIKGDILPCMCERLVYLKNKKAKILFIEGGINDLAFTKNKTDSLLHYYKTIVAFAKSENMIPVIQLVFYTSRNRMWPDVEDYTRLNETVTELNTKIVAYAEMNEIDYIDLNKVIADEHHVLKEQYTQDGLHLTQEGYDEWAKLINEVLVKYKI